MNGEQLTIDLHQADAMSKTYLDAVRFMRTTTPPGTRATDPVTSHEAEARVRPHASTGRRAVLSALALYGPLTDFELAERTGWQQTSIGKRRGECVALGYVEAFTAPDGTKCKRPSPSGSPAIVWAITAKGREAHDAMRNESR